MEDPVALGTVRPGASPHRDLTYPSSMSLTPEGAHSGGPTVSTPSFNPAALLNPKSAASKNKAEPQLKDIQSNNHETADTNGTSNFSSLLERHHGVTKCEAPAMKRKDEPHQDEDNDRKRSKFTGTIGKGGIIGQSVRDIRQQAQDEEDGPPAFVDLTEEDDVTIVSARHIGPDPGQEVCFGVMNAQVLAHCVPFVSNKASETFKDKWPPSKVSIARVPGQVLQLDVIDKKDTRFAKVDFREARPLAELLNGRGIHKFRFSAVLDVRNKKGNEKPGDSISERMTVRITLFCMRSASEAIRRILSQNNIFLQYPIASTEGREVVFPSHKNPSLHNNATAGRTRQVDNVLYFNRTVEEIQRDVQNIIDNLPNSQGLPFKEADPAIVSTSLLEHQKQALHFLTAKENPSKDDEGTLWKWRGKKDRTDSWYHVITGQEVSQIPHARGGLFADDMGLGKTLSTLSLIASTFEEAKEFGSRRPSSDILKEHPFVKCNLKATLIICPKSVLTNWQEQIKAHLNSNAVKYYIYDGSNRERDLSKLAKYDIVIASFSIVSAEYRSRDNLKGTLTLHRCNWFRIVLDEAHTIRNMASGLFVSCYELASERRWAVTGTPVQNRLDDLGALVKFVRIAPFHEKAQWEQHFTSAFRSLNEQAIDNLRLLVSSIMLRRSKKTINLEDATMVTEYLDFTDEERGLYEAFAKDTHRRMEAMTHNGKIASHGTAHMLKFIGRLRQICCHGKDLLSDEDMKLLDGKSIGTAIDLGEENDDKPAMTDDQIYSLVIMMRDSNANCCSYDEREEIGRVVEVVDDAETDDEDLTEESADTPSSSQTGSHDSVDVLGYITPCYHLICPKHIDKYRNDITPTLTTDGFAICPLCMNYIRATFPPVLRSGLDAAVLARDAARKQATRSGSKKNTGTYTGPHTKVRALLTHLARDAEASLPLLAVGEPPIRSVVFSFWTHNLDLIALALDNAGVVHLRLEGRMSVKARSAVLERFRTDPSVTVLLVSITAGGVGLNLTAASRVYVMEPQFNPGLELQAVDRVHRIGQKRKVQIVKFIMADSFEGKIVKLQEQKMNLWKEALGHGEKDKAPRKERLENLRSLFR